LGAIVVIVILGLYFVPVIVGAIRSVPNIGSVFVVNFFLGWTFIGWVVALAMASRSQPAPVQLQATQQVSHADPELQEVVAKAIADHEQRKTPPEPPA
jgi:hypothetical protein